MPERANPETCQHRVIQKIEDFHAPDFLGLCVSCDSTLSPEWVGENHWVYNIDHHVWVWEEPCDCDDDDPLEGLTVSTVELDEEGRVYLDVRDGGVERTQAPADSGD
jgi:hypothetical protein